jgi:cytochrome P450 / NADPH-cytochrome P450 reductase
MDFRFNSYYHDEMHPFISAMGDFLTESGNRSRRPPLPSFFYRQTDAKYFANIELMRKTSDEVLQARKAHPNDRKDLLNAMLNGRDPKTKQGLSDASITDNLITFLIAGHETTSGLLSFAFYQLLKHPEAYQKAQKEVDEVCGTGPIKVEHLAKLPYINAILRETLRNNSTIPAISRTAKQDDVIGGKYPVKKGEPIICLLAKCHRDPVVYGSDADEFKPERMLDENFDRLNKEFPNCWKPFGNGARACIGRPFAWQEALLVMAMLLQNFNFVMDDPSYQLLIKQTLTIKPKGFHMRAILRRGLTPTQLEQSLTSSARTMPTPASGGANKGTQASSAKGKPIAIYYGSNTGTCESLANRLASDAPAHGFSAITVDSLDAANQKVAPEHPIVIITASYEGQPPDNAAHFVAWLEGLKEGCKAMENVSYAVFGCGHHDWAQTFHRIPKLVDSRMAELGGHRIAAIGLSDAAKGDMFTDFETWEDTVFWPGMAEKYGISEDDATQTTSMSVEVTAPRCSTLRQDVKEAFVVTTKDLTTPDVPAKKHIEIQLPSDVTYSAGDYLAVLPINPQEVIQRAMRKFQLAWDSHLTITSSGPTLLPINTSVPASDVFGAYVELAQPATKRNLSALIPFTKDAAIQSKLQSLASTDYASEISAKRVSVLDLLESYPSITLPLPSFLSMLPPMRVRQYSISSSPLWNPHHVTLTYSVLDVPSYSAPDHKRHIGVASNYLSSLSPGDKLHVAVKLSHALFHLPTDAENVPIMLIAAGTGLAPFRGFLQERAAQVAAGRELAECVLWFGCRHPDKDDLYSTEFAKWEKMDVVEVRRAYSRKPEASDGCKFVQDRLWLDREKIDGLWNKGARVFVCGSREVGEAVGAVARKIMMANVGKREKAEGKEVGITEERANKWFEGVRNVRYATDVFA